MSVIPGSGAVAGLSEQLEGFAKAKGTIQFTLDKPLPQDLLVAIVQQRMAEIDS